MHRDITEQAYVIIICPNVSQFSLDHLTGPFHLCLPALVPTLPSGGAEQLSVDKLKEEDSLKVRAEIKERLNVLPQAPSHWGQGGPAE